MQDEINVIDAAVKVRVLADIRDALPFPEVPPKHVNRRQEPMVDADFPGWSRTLIAGEGRGELFIPPGSLVKPPGSWARKID
jgi:hypothetical protein